MLYIPPASLVKEAFRAFIHDQHHTLKSACELFELRVDTTRIWLGRDSSAMRYDTMLGLIKCLEEQGVRFHEDGTVFVPRAEAKGAALSRPPLSAQQERHADRTPPLDTFG